MVFSETVLKPRDFLFFFFFKPRDFSVLDTYLCLQQAWIPVWPNSLPFGTLQAFERLVHAGSVPVFSLSSAKQTIQETWLSSLSSCFPLWSSEERPLIPLWDHVSPVLIFLDKNYFYLITAIIVWISSTVNMMPFFLKSWVILHCENVLGIL